MSDKPTNQVLESWIRQLQPKPSQVPILKEKIEKWKTKKATIVNQYDEEICDFHIEYLQAQNDIVKCELEACDIINFERLTELYKKYPNLVQEISIQHNRIKNVELADRIIGKASIRI